MLAATIRASQQTVGLFRNSDKAIISQFFNVYHSVVENAKLFKEELLKRNVKNSANLNLQSLRLGINSVIALSNPKTIANYRKLDKLTLADNAVTDYGMHAIKTIINITKLSSLNLASNMISGEGLELILDDLIANSTIKTLDLGVVETSMRKNSLGI